MLNQFRLVLFKTIIRAISYSIQKELRDSIELKFLDSHQLDIIDEMIFFYG